MSELKWTAEGLSENAVDALALRHNLYVAPGGKELVGQEITDDLAPVVEVDIAFAKLHPNLPIENVCSTLGNYAPQNESQTNFLVMASKLANYLNPSRLAGFIACGGAGLGKTHISVGVAKAAMLTGQTPYFVNIPSTRPLDVDMRKAEKADIVVLDDMNNRYDPAFGSIQATKLLTAMFNAGGGKLMITSNSPNSETFLRDILLPTDPVDRVRIADRVASSLLGLNIMGDSFRAQSAAGQKPWWEE